jgi:hypothetical protein
MEETGFCAGEFQADGILQGGVMMKVLRILRSLWYCWCSLWQLNWDRSPGLDFHKWESKMEVHRRLSGPHL